MTVLTQIRDVIDTRSSHDLDDYDGVFPRELSDNSSARNDDEDEDDDEGIKEAIHQFERRELPQSQPLTHQINGDDCDNREGLYVPMLYAGYVSADGTDWKRYQCDVTSKSGDDDDFKKDKCRVHSTKDGLSKVPRGVITDGLASCTSISIISRRGVMITHVPPFVCEILDDKNSRPDDKLAHKRTELIKGATKKLKDEYLEKMGGREKVTVVAVTGPFSGAADDDARERAAKVTKYLFDLDMNYWDRISQRRDYPPGWRSTSVDLTQDPPVFYREDTRLEFPIP